MATANLTLKVSAEGLAQLLAQSDSFNKNMQAGAAAAKSAGGTAGSRALSGSSSSSSGPVSYAKAENNAYNLARGTGSGSTGSGSSDFAAQARGLGGLVHVYATFAANLFAAEAAFRALSNAMDTQNLIKGLDQLGAASGRALGSLAKQMVQVSDSALSMKEAMTATALASSGGMTNDAILRMTNVAKQASQALGRDMSDSMDRLTKGIVKIQPELLDELGIMARVIPSQQEYARTLGKSVSSLTDFEKRQAFANAVLDEGEKKFNALKIDSNPYSKLLASLKDIAQTGLTLVNSVLTPLVSALASSPVGLSVVLAGIATTLIGKALPALSQWREGLTKAAEESAKTAKKLSDMHESFQINKSLGAISDITEPMQRAAGAAIADLQTMLGKALPPTSKLIKNALSDSFDISAEIPKYTRSITQITSQITALEALKSKASASGDTAKLGLYDTELAALTARKTNMEAIAAKAKDALQLQKDLNSELGRQHDALENINPAYLSLESSLKRIAENAKQGAMKAGVLANVGSNTQIMGITDSLKTMHLEIQHGIENVQKYREGLISAEELKKTSSGMDGLTKTTTYLSGSLRAIGGTIMTVVSSLGNIGAAIGIAVGTFELLNSWFATDTKSSEELTKALGRLKDASDNVNNVMKDLEKRDPLYLISSKAMEARATAINEVSSNLPKLLTAAKTQMQDAGKGLWSMVIEGWKGILGTGALDKASEQMAQNIAESFALASDGPAKEKATQALQDLFGAKIDPTNIKELSKFLNADTIYKFGSSVTKIMSQFGVSLAEAANKAKAVDDAFTAASKSYDTITASMMPTDNLAKLGMDTMALGQQMAAAFDDPKVAIAELANTINNTSRLKLLSPEFVADLQKNNAAINNTTQNYAVLSKSLTNDEKRLSELRDTLNKTLEDLRNANPEGPSFKGAVSNVAKASKSVGDQQNVVDMEKKTLQGFQDKLAPFIAKFGKEAYDSIARGAEMIHVSISTGFEKAAITVKQAYAQGLTGTSGGIAENALLAKQSLAIQLRQYDASIGLISSMEKLRQSNEQLDIGREKDRVAAMKEGSDKEIAKAKLATREGIAKLDFSDKTVTQLANIIKTGTTEEKAAASAAMPAAQQTEAAKAGRAGVVSQMQATDIGKQFALMDHQAQLEKDSLSVNAARLDQEKIRLDLSSKYAAYQTDSMLEAQKANEESRIANTLAQETVDYENQREKAVKAYNAAKRGSEDEANALSSINELDRAKERKDEKDRLAAQGRDLVNADKKLQAEQARYDFQARIAKATTDIIDIEQKTGLSVREETLAIMINMGVLSEEALVKAKEELELDKEKQRSAQTLVQLAQDRQAIIDASTVKLKGAGTNQEAIKQILDERNAQLALNDARVTGEQTVTAAKQASIIAQGEHNALMAKQAEQMGVMVDITQDLTTAFGDFGTSIGKASEAILKIAQDDTAYLEKKKSLQEAIAKGSYDGASEEELRNAKVAQTALIKLDKDKTKSELVNQATVVGSVKSMFDVKSKTYKALDSIEKAYHIAKLAMDMKEFAVKMGILTAVPAAKVGSEAAETAAQEAGAASRAPSLIAEVYAKTIGQLGPIAGPIVATGLVAAFLSALGESGGSAPPVDQGTLAGTGQSADGSIRAGGVVGDPKATAKSLTDSIDGLSKVFFNNMGSQSSTLIKHLKGIQENTYDTAKALGAAGTIGSGNPFGAATGSSKAFNTGVGLLDNVLGGIFGGNTSKSITGTGIRGTGTAAGLAEDASRIQGYTNIHTETSGGWFSSGSSSDTTVMSKLDTSITKGLQGIFKNFNNVLLDTAEGLGKSRDDIQKILDTTSIDLNVSSAGLTGTEFAQKLSAEVSIQLNKVAEQAYPFISMYTKVGEESFQTATRLIKDSETVTFGLKMVGKALGDGNLEDKIATQQEIIKNFGGTADDFAAAMEAYYNGLFTDSEKLKFSFGNVQDQLKKLGHGGITTNQQLKDLIASLDPSSELYASLIKLVPAFTDMTAAMQKMQDAMDNLQGQALDLIATTVGTTAEEAAKAAKAAQDLRRANTLRNTDPALKSMQKYVFALEDLKNAEAKLADMRKKNLSITKKATDDQVNTLKSSISSMDNFIKSLDNFQNSLLVGQDSVLTPGQKYQQTKQHFSDLLATATTSAITPEQQKAKDEALSQLQGASTDFLSASKLYNASSDQYALDFNLVQSAIMSTSSTLKIQKSVAQSSLDELTAQSTVMQAQLDALDKVNNAIQDETSAVNDVSAAQQAVADALDAMSKDQNAYSAEVIDTFTKGTDNIVAAITDLPQGIADAKKAADAKQAAADKLAADKLLATEKAAKEADVKIAQLIKSQGGSSAMQAQEQSAWDKMTNQEKSDYYAANPTMSSITQFFQKVFGFTTIGAIVNALDPANAKLQSLIAQGDYSGQLGADGMPIGQKALDAMVKSLTEAAAATEANTSATEAQTSATESTNNSAIAAGYSPAADSNAASSASAGDAAGGISGTGVRLVGEHGPELVDFATSGRIYTANDTSKLFGGHLNGHNHNRAVVAELKALRAELNALREQQRQETGHLIMAAYDSQDQNAQAVTDAVVSTSDNQAWAAKVAASARV